MEYRAPAPEQARGGIFFGSLIMLLPFCAALPGATGQVDEVRSRAA